MSSFHVKQGSIEPNGAPPAPPSAARVFGEKVGVAAAYADLLATDATVRGLIGPREVARLWERHLLNCALVTDLVGPDSTVCDVGSGAGLPGLVMAIRRPDLRVTLVEPLLRAWLGLPDETPRQVPLAADCDKRAGLMAAFHGTLRCDAEGRLRAHVGAAQASFRVLPFSQSSVWITLPEAATRIAAGTLVHVHGHGHLQPLPWEHA